MISRNYFPKNQAPVQPERAEPSPVSSNVNQAPGNPAFVGVVPSPTPSQMLGSGPPPVNMNASLLDQQFPNVMRMPPSSLAQSKTVTACLHALAISATIFSTTFSFWCVRTLGHTSGKIVSKNFGVNSFQ